jgi:hypothetical protein
MLTCKKKIEKKREQNEQLSSNLSFTLFAFMMNKYGDLPDNIYNQCLPEEN